MNDNYAEWEIGKRAWAGFSKAVAILVTMVLAAINGNVTNASITIGISIWVILNLARFVMPDVYMRNIWSIVGLPIKTISAWPIMWLLVAVLGFIGFSKGMSVGEFAQIIVLYIIGWIIEIIMDAIFLRRRS